MSRRGDADVLFVCYTAAEKLVAEGVGIKRLDVMYNDFILVGPTSDPAARGARHRGALEAGGLKAAFISRSDKAAHSAGCATGRPPARPLATTMSGYKGTAAA
jgi:tungstate transport system substrate-binding protein